MDQETPPQALREPGGGTVDAVCSRTKASARWGNGAVGGDGDNLLPSVYLMCGFVGAGKTTLARKIERDRPAVRLSLDEWMIPLFGQDIPREVFDRQVGVFESLFAGMTERLVGLNVSVVLDYGFWSKRQRQETSDWIRRLGAVPHLVYLSCPYELARDRAMYRQRIDGGRHYHLSEDALQLFWNWFDPPSPEEEETLEIATADNAAGHDHLC